MSSVVREWTQRLSYESSPTLPDPSSTPAGNTSVIHAVTSAKGHSGCMSHPAVSPKCSIVGGMDETSGWSRQAHISIGMQPPSTDAKPVGRSKLVEVGAIRCICMHG